MYGGVYVVYRDYEYCYKIIPKKVFNNQEFEITQQIRYEQIVKCIYKYDVENVVVLKMEYMNEGDLREFIESHTEDFSEDELQLLHSNSFFLFFFYFFYSLVNRLHVIHSQKFMHRFNFYFCL
jgi:serine/threonine protein kinase